VAAEGLPDIRRALRLLRGCKPNRARLVMCVSLCEASILLTSNMRKMFFYTVVLCPM
jgi:hypothetical protein